MPEKIISRIGPQEYLDDFTAYQELIPYLQRKKIHRILFLHGQKAWQAAKKQLPDLTAEFLVEFVEFGGEASYEEVARLKKITESQNSEVLIALGGGKVLDTIKELADQIQQPFILIPTVASNCAPWSALSVLYSETGQFVDFKTYDQTAALLLIQPEVLFQSPVAYFIAGAVDTLAKFYESDWILKNLKTSDQLTLLHTRYFAENCRDIILTHGEKAVADMQTGILSREWRLVASTIIVTAGLVGGLGDQYGRATAAHSVHDALTQFPETHLVLHGAKVGYGILIQLAFEKKLRELVQVTNWLEALNSPTHLKDLGLANDSSVKKQLAQAATTLDKSIHYLPQVTNPETLYQAIEIVEEN